MRQVGGTHWGFSAEIGEPGGALPDPPRREVLKDTGLRVLAAELPEPGGWRRQVLQLYGPVPGGPPG